jgi:hypothetical protein
MSLRDLSEQLDFEALRFGPPFLDADGRSPQIDVIDDFAKAVGEMCRVRLVDVHHLGPGRIAA